MTPTAPAIAPAPLVRISVVGNDRRLDIGVPGTVPLVELVPGFARALGALDPTLIHGGFSLTRADGSTLDPERGILVQRVADGEILTLVTGALRPEPRIHDDIVEAVADAVERDTAPWTAKDSSNTALAMAAGILAVAALLLLGAGQGSPLASVIAGSGAVLTLTAAAVLCRLGQSTAGLVLLMIAPVFGAVSAYTALPPSPLWGWPLAAAGAGALVTGALGAALVREHRVEAFIPVLIGAAIGTAGTITGLSDGDPAGIYAITVAIVVALGNGSPWLAMSSARIQAISPQSEQEIFGAVPRVDGEETAQRHRLGHRILLVLRTASGVVTLSAVPLLVTSGVPGALLCTAAFLGMMLGARMSATRADVLVLMATGVGGITLSGLVAALAHPEWRIVLVAVLAVAACALIALTMLTARPGLRFSRIADTIDVFALALVLPLGVAVAGLG